MGASGSRQALPGSRLCPAGHGGVRHVGRARLVLSGCVEAADGQPGGMARFPLPAAQELGRRTLAPGVGCRSDRPQPGRTDRAGALFYWTMRFFARLRPAFRRLAERWRRRSTPACPSSRIGTSSAGVSTCPVRWPTMPTSRAPDAAMGGHDWLEFGRMRGCTMLWTEDWFGDGQAYAVVVLLREPALRRGSKGGVEFGGYVIPRTAGRPAGRDRAEDPRVIGSGGKAAEVLRLRPRSTTSPATATRRMSTVLPQMAEAHGMIGAARTCSGRGASPQRGWRSWRRAARRDVGREGRCAMPNRHRQDADQR